MNFWSYVERLACKSLQMSEQTASCEVKELYAWSHHHSPNAAYISCSLERLILIEQLMPSVKAEYVSAPKSAR